MVRLPLGDVVGLNFSGVSQMKKGGGDNRKYKTKKRHTASSPANNTDQRRRVVAYAVNTHVGHGVVHRVVRSFFVKLCFGCPRDKRPSELTDTPLS